MGTLRAPADAYGTMKIIAQEQPKDLHYILVECDDAGHKARATVDLHETIFDEIPFKTPGIRTALDAVIEAVNQGEFLSVFAFDPSRWDGGYEADQDSEVLISQLRDKAFNHLDRDALVQVNCLIPGCIYAETKVRKELARQSRIAVWALSDEAKMRARLWLKQVCIPGEIRSRRRITFLGRPVLYPFFRVYFDVVKIREVAQLIRQKTGGALRDIRSVKRLRNVFPKMLLSDDEILIAAGVTAERRKRVSAVIVAATLLGKAIGYRERVIRNEIRTSLTDWPSRRPRIKKLAAEIAQKISSDRLLPVD